MPGFQKLKKKKNYLIPKLVLSIFPLHSMNSFFLLKLKIVTVEVSHVTWMVTPVLTVPPIFPNVEKLCAFHNVIDKRPFCHDNIQAKHQVYLMVFLPLQHMPKWNRNLRHCRT